MLKCNFLYGAGFAERDENINLQTPLLASDYRTDELTLQLPKPPSFLLGKCHPVTTIAYRLVPFLSNKGNRFRFLFLPTTIAFEISGLGESILTITASRWVSFLDFELGWQILIHRLEDWLDKRARENTSLTVERLKM